MVYRPLFFNDYMTVQQNVKREYDLLFIGTIHSDRHRILKQIKEICLKQNLTYFYYMYLPSKILFYLRSLVDPSLWRSKLSDFSFSALKKTDIIGLVEKCRAVIDIQHPKQIGLTIRTMEVLERGENCFQQTGILLTTIFMLPPIFRFLIEKILT